jgi:O-antigen/teichoic acid export membrane protein
MKDLKERAIRGGFARVCAQSLYFALRIGALMVLARLLDPKDFGLVGMVTAFTSVLNLFRDFGLSTVTVQRVDISEEQISTLFWVNVLVGAILTVSLAVMAPVVARFYHEPRLYWVTIILATGFLINAAGVQHSALLQREIRFTALAVIQVVALVVSTALGIGAALLGYGYWSLVVLSLTLPMVSTVACWLATSWIPSRPRKGVGIRPMIHFGGSVTLISLIVYVAYNLDKVLLGRFWGAEALGIYGRSYQIINIPTDNLNSAVGEVAFAALSRLQGDPVRLRNYFLKGYSLVLALTVPITCIIAIFPHDLVMVILGVKWGAAAKILQLLAPTVLVFAVINPLGWLLFAIGMIKRSLKIALVLTPVVIAGYCLGLRYGPNGVALGFSAAITLWALPHIAWGVHGTPISFGDIIKVMTKPLFSGIVAVAFALGFQALCSQWPPFPRLFLGATILLGIYGVILLYVMGQRGFYVDLLRQLFRRSSVDAEPPVVIQEAS